MKLRLVVLSIAAAALMSVSSVQLSAHHSFAATYFEDKQEKVEGELAQFLFRNPHSFIQLDVKQSNGEVVRYSIKWDNNNQLGRQGVSRDTLKVGDHVIVVGNPGRNPEDHRLRMVRLQRPSDGYTWGGRPGETFD